MSKGLEISKGDRLYDIDEREYVTAEKKAHADLKRAKAEINNWQRKSIR